MLPLVPIQLEAGTLTCSLSPCPFLLHQQAPPILTCLLLFHLAQGPWGSCFSSFSMFFSGNKSLFSQSPILTQGSYKKKYVGARGARQHYGPLASPPYHLVDLRPIWPTKAGVPSGLLTSLQVRLQLNSKDTLTPRGFHVCVETFSDKDEV